MEFKEIKVKKIEILEKKESVYDINVNDVHHYILDNGIITHNTMDLFPKEVQKGGNATTYSASTICFMSKAKLKEGQEDELDLNQSGIIVTAKMVKNRMAKPKKVKFHISFVDGTNPYIGLDYWLTPENFPKIGIAKGKMVDDKFVAGGNRWYVKHLGKHVPTADLFTSKVFTDDVLNLIEPVINDYFKYKSITEMQEINKRLEEAKGEMSEKDLYGEDNLSSSALFDDED